MADEKDTKLVDENDPALGSAEKRDDGLTGDPRESTALAEESRIRRERAEDDAKKAKGKPASDKDEPKPAPSSKRGAA